MLALVLMPVFSEEAAGLNDHPMFTAAQSVSASNTAFQAGIDDVTVFMENCRVADPEGTNIPGRTLRANAIRNLTSARERTDSNTQLPDLLFSHSSFPIREYDNPSLFPGMYPTLWPLGIGGVRRLFSPCSTLFQCTIQLLS